MLRLAVLFHDTGKAATMSRDDAGRIHFYGHSEHSMREMEKAARNLRLSRSSRDFLMRVVDNHMRIATHLAEAPSDQATIRLARVLGEETVDVVLLSTADRSRPWGRLPRRRECGRSSIWELNCSTGTSGT